MNIILAKTAGFCFGVERAVNKVYEEIEKNKGIIYTYGPIIHNEEVVKDLESKGVQVINSYDELKSIKAGTVIIRSHGVPKEVYDTLEENNLTYVDATCPFVKKIHKIVYEESNKDNNIIIIGDADHPEVQGIRGWCLHDSIFVVNNAEEADKLTINNSNISCIVSQTTFKHNKFKELVEIIEKKGYDIIVVNTICSATEERQNEAAKIAAEVDAMIVIGGRTSSNTRKLFEISNRECKNTYYIQTVEDLKNQKFKPVENVGITAGASTPRNIIEEVQKYVRNE